MQISLTQEQYQTLVELVSLGQWVANAHRTETIKKYEEVEQAVYAAAGPTGLEDCVEYDEEAQLFFAARQLEESRLFPLKDEYDEYTFWEELTERLSWRDMEKKAGKELAPGEASEEQLKLLETAAQAYADEFDKTGIDRLELAGR